MSENNEEPKSIEAKLPWYYNLYNTIKDTPINLTLFFVSAFVFYKVMNITRQRRNRNNILNLFCNEQMSGNPQLPPLHRVFTVKHLLEYNGIRNDARILVAVNFNVYDVSCAKHVYGPTGAYPQWAGRDISRNLINFSAVRIKCQKFDDLSDLTEEQRNNLLEWDQRFMEKFPFVGRLVCDEEDEVPSISYESEELNEM